MRAVHERRGVPWLYSLATMPSGTYFKRDLMPVTSSAAIMRGALPPSVRDCATWIFLSWRTYMASARKGDVN